jgi:hypothetical protein
MYLNKLNQIAIVACLVIGILALRPVIANDQPAVTSGKAVHSFEVGPEISWTRYSEPHYMHNDGIMYGGTASYIYRGPLFIGPSRADDWMLRADGRANWGHVNYDGALQDGTPYTVDNIDDYMLEFRGLIGYGFQNRIARTTPYSGFGYRYLNDDSSFDPAGYKRESNYFYLPLGFEVYFLSETAWSFSTIFEYDFLLWGRQKSHLGDSIGTIENNQDTGHGFRASIRFQKEGKGVDFAIEPFFRYWNIGESEHVDRVFGSEVVRFTEPKNYSTEFGLRVLWQF